MDDLENIRSHYNRRPNKSVEERKYTKNINIRNANNKVKACLIKKYARPHDEVLDLGIGKGGDFAKYRNAGIGLLYGIDIANRSIVDATERAMDGQYPFKIILKTRDAFTAFFDLKRSFDLVSAQFSFHYSFSSETVLDTAIANIKRHIRYDGYFIFTTLDKGEILRRRALGHLKNDYYRIEFAESKGEGVYGQRYYYTLIDSLDSCVEYLVDMETLEKKCVDAGLRLVEKISFEDFLMRERFRADSHYKKAIHNELNAQEREVFDLHIVVVFQRQG